MIKEYDRQSAVAYAKKWALDKNPSFNYFDDLGGDCTNFVSQCLLAGGVIMNFDKYYGWFYKNSFDRSPSWTGVEYLKQFLLSKKTIRGVCRNGKIRQVGYWRYNTIKTRTSKI